MFHSSSAYLDVVLVENIFEVAMQLLSALLDLLLRELLHQLLLVLGDPLG